MRLEALDWPPPCARTSLRPEPRAEMIVGKVDERDDAGSRYGTRAHRTDIGPPELIRGHVGNGNCAGVDGHVAGELAEEFDSGHHQKPGNDAAWLSGCEVHAWKVFIKKV